MKGENREELIRRREDMEALTNTRLRLREVEMLLGISKTLAEFDTLDDMLMKLVEITTLEIGADRGTIFLNDSTTGELYSRVAQGNFKREIRILNDSGIAGWVFKTGDGTIVNDAYADSRFNPDIDKKTGYVTKSILCVPIRTVKGDVIGVAQCLNKLKGDFTPDDLKILAAMTTQAAVALRGAQFIEQIQKNRIQEMQFVDVVSNITSEIDLGSLLQKVMAEATRMLNAERSTLFINDPKRRELFSQVGEGLGATQIRLPNTAGIAGAVFTTGRTINIPHAYADLRFNPSFDRKTGFFTRSILCTPIVNKSGNIIGVTQVLNKRGGPFTDEDESRLKAFTAQVSIALENARLFGDIQNMKNYNESILQSMTNAVITLDEEGTIITCNAAGFRILHIAEEDILGKKFEEFFAAPNDWIVDRIKRVDETRRPDVTMDADLVSGGEKLSVNLTILPLVSTENKKLGSMIMIEDISSEKRMKSTMSRYMDPGLADQLMARGEDILGGKSAVATILFSDIRSFTTLTEELGAQGTVALLNEYFTIMVDCIMQEGGMLDKFIGDAIMAAFGIPLPHGDDEDRAVRAAISMHHHLKEWNAARASEGKKPVNIGIGLNTDTVVSGNIGSPKRMDYTLIGDGVNLASRLESACKQYHAKILISENTYRKLRGTYRIREIDRVVVKGKTEPVSIFEVLDHHDDRTFPNLMESVNHFNEGVMHYRGCRWDRAVRSFSAVLGLNPGDTLSKLYIERCYELEKNPPEGEWDGVWRMTSK